MKRRTKKKYATKGRELHKKLCKRNAGSHRRWSARALLFFFGESLISRMARYGLFSKGRTDRMVGRIQLNQV